MIVTLRNSFHNTLACVRAAEDGTFRVSRRTAQLLCGMSDCTCGTVRGPQYRDGVRADFEFAGQAEDEHLYRLSTIGRD